MTAGVEERTLEVPARAVPYREWGEPGARSLVWLHGLFGNSAEWDTVAATLAGDHRVVVPDQRGHGVAGWGNDYSAPRLMTDLADLVTGLELDGFDLVGHSMGGIVSLLYAASRPVGLRRLVLVDIGPEALADAEARAGFLEMLDVVGRASYGSVEEAVSSWLSEDPLAGREETTHWARRALRQGPDGRWSWRIDAAGIGEFLTRAPSPGVLWSAVDAVEVPTLVVRGELSWALPEKDAERLVSRLRNGSIATVAGAGHDLGVQAPHQVAACVREFLAD